MFFLFDKVGQIKVEAAGIDDKDWDIVDVLKVGLDWDLVLVKLLTAFTH